MSSFVQHKNGELNEANVAIQHAIDANAIQTATAESRVRDGRCIIRSLKGDFDKDPDVLMNFSNCVGAGKKAIVVLGDSHSIDLFNSVNILSSHDFILGLTKGSAHLHREAQRQHQGHSFHSQGKLSTHRHIER
jgi:hypothetical protein